jgi:hypothetical protein
MVIIRKTTHEKGIRTVAFDSDPEVVERLYEAFQGDSEQRTLPLVMDLCNPTPSLGWRLYERQSLLSRGPTDTVLALALIHHLAIANNVPLRELARFFSGICSNLVVEFVPKDDSQVQRMLATREDIFDRYTKDSFEQEFTKEFEIKKTEGFGESSRTLYLMSNRSSTRSE